MDFFRIFAVNMKQELLEISRKISELAEQLNALAARYEQELNACPHAEDVCECDESTKEQPDMPAITEAPTEAETPNIVQSPQPIKPIQFTLNDRYRFLREIFGNSISEMTDAITDMEQMSSAEEVTAYVIGTLNQDPEQQITKDFLAAVNERFNERPTLLA